MDLNADLGEGFGAYTFGQDEALLNVITSANIACGFHAGDPQVMDRTVQLAKERSVYIGAHPGYPDREGFGRRHIPYTCQEIANQIIYQIGALAAFAIRHQTVLHHVKLHGALYNFSASNEEMAICITDAIAAFNRQLILYAPSGSLLVKVAESRGLKVWQEFFADREYEVDGTLTPRHVKGSVIDDVDLVVERVLYAILNGQVKARTGEIISLELDTICIHGDHQGAAIIARHLKESFIKAGIK